MSDEMGILQYDAVHACISIISIQHITIIQTS